MVCAGGDEEIEILNAALSAFAIELIKEKLIGFETAKLSILKVFAQ